MALSLFLKIVKARGSRHKPPRQVDVKTTNISPVMKKVLFCMPMVLLSE